MSVNVLISYAFHAKANLDELRRDLVCGKLMIDSGAFTTHSIGQEIDLAGYAEYLHTWRGRWDYAITLDKIGDPKATRANTRKLHEQGLRVMPVFTRGESIREFDAMVKDSGYVCVGGGVGMGRAVMLRRMTLLSQRAAGLGGGVHALGMGATAHMKAAAPYSGDASNISNTFRFGIVRFFDGRNIIPIQASDKDGLRKHWQDLRAHDIDVGLIARFGRMPTAEHRHVLMRSMGLAFASADEWLRTVVPPVPAPWSTTDPVAGPHLYSAVVGSHLLPGTVELDRRLHEDYAPPVWVQYGRTHQCRVAVA